MKTTSILAAAAALSLAGCATTYELAVMPHDSGRIFTGRATDTGSGQGPISIDLENRQYTGTWVATTPSRTYGVVAGGWGWGRGWGWGAAGSTVSMDNPAGTEAKALLQSQDGTGLRCDLRIGQGTGGGMCRDDAGRVYDVQLRPAPRA
jgi:hypothetical protein